MRAEVKELSMRSLTAALWLALGLAIAPAAAQDALPAVEWVACWMALPDDIVDGQNLDCGYLLAPEDRDDPASPVIELAFAILYAPAADVKPDPVVYLAGGPGGNAVGELEGWLDVPYLQDRDLILLDQRGTGYSLPSLNCPEMEKNAEGAALACRDRLRGAGVNLQAYNSAANAADVADLRIALGYDEWNLYGISYGTRLALTVMRDHPDGIRSVVLDSVYPPEVNSWEQYGQNTVEAFSRLFQSCAADAECAAAYPDLEQVFYDAVAALDAEPAEYAGIDPDTGSGIQQSLSGSGLIDRVFQLLYATESIPFLPWVITEVGAGNYAALDELETGELLDKGRQPAADEDITDSEGMNLSVECQEEIAFLDEARSLAGVPAQPAALYRNSIATIQATFSDCRVWAVAAADPRETQPVVSAIPTLVVAGGFDPITPPKWAESAASHLPNSFYFLFPAGGHGVIDMNLCSQSIMQAFLDDPTRRPDGSCISEMSAPLWALPSG